VVGDQLRPRRVTDAIADAKRVSDALHPSLAPTDPHPEESRA
jgi:hypothetical protein